MCEVFALLKGTSYLERVTVNKPAAVIKAKKAIARAFEHQAKKTGFSMVEILSMCPTNWKMGVLESCKWIDDVMSKEFPLGVIKDTLS
jgi:2-oxoglutarate ferredoxin oxidoreductase subunit beta